MSSVPPAPRPDFRTLVDEHYTGLYRFAYSLAKNEDQAGDLVQQTFLIWAQKGDSLREGSKAKSWLFTTLYREFLRLKRKDAPRTDLEPEQLENSLARVEPDYVQGLDARRAVEALEEIDEIYRAPLTLFYLKDLSYKEIAATLDIPIGTVMSRLSRGKAQLKQALVEGPPAEAREEDVR